MLSLQKMELLQKHNNRITTWYHILYLVYVYMKLNQILKETFAHYDQYSIICGHQQVGLSKCGTGFQLTISLKKDVVFTSL